MRNHKRRALVTGGFGFIGSHLVDVILESGQACTVVDSLFHGAYPHAAHLLGKTDFRQVSILDTDGLDRVFGETAPQDVYHLASHHFIPYCDRNPAEALDVNVIGTQRVADACEKHGVEKLFIASTAAVYGISDQPHAETECANPVDIYGVTKYASERIGSILSARSKVLVRTGRYFNAVGSRETNPHIIPEILSQLRAAEGKPVLRLGNVSAKRDYVHAADLAAATFTVMAAATAEPYDLVNIGSGEAYAVSEIVELFARELGTAIRIDTDPDKLRRIDRPVLRADTGKMARVYGWRPHIDLPQVVRELATEFTTGTGKSRLTAERT